MDRLKLMIAELTTRSSSPGSKTDDIDRNTSFISSSVRARLKAKYLQQKKNRTKNHNNDVSLTSSSEENATVENSMCSKAQSQNFHSSNSNLKDTLPPNTDVADFMMTKNVMLAEPQGEISTTLSDKGKKITPDVHTSDCTDVDGESMSDGKSDVFVSPSIINTEPSILIIQNDSSTYSNQSYSLNASVESEKSPKKSPVVISGQNKINGCNYRDKVNKKERSRSTPDNNIPSTIKFSNGEDLKDNSKSIHKISSTKLAKGTNKTGHESPSPMLGRGSNKNNEKDNNSETNVSRDAHIKGRVKSFKRNHSKISKVDNMPNNNGINMDRSSFIDGLDVEKCNGNDKLSTLTSNSNLSGSEKRINPSPTNLKKSIMERMQSNLLKQDVSLVKKDTTEKNAISMNSCPDKMMTQGKKMPDNYLDKCSTVSSQVEKSAVSTNTIYRRKVVMRKDSLDSLGNINPPYINNNLASTQTTNLAISTRRKGRSKDVPILPVDRVPCPICSNYFDALDIEKHASRCGVSRRTREQHKSNKQSHGNSQVSTTVANPSRKRSRKDSNTQVASKINPPSCPENCSVESGERQFVGASKFSLPGNISSSKSVNIIPPKSVNEFSRKQKRKKHNKSKKLISEWKESATFDESMSTFDLSTVSLGENQNTSVDMDLTRTYRNKEATLNVKSRSKMKKISGAKLDDVRKSVQKSDASVQNIFPSILLGSGNGIIKKSWGHDKNVLHMERSTPVSSKPYASANDAKKFLELINVLVFKAETAWRVGRKENESEFPFTAPDVVLKVIGEIRKTHDGILSTFRFMKSVKKIIIEVSSFLSDQESHLIVEKIFNCFENFLPYHYKMKNIVIDDPNQQRLDFSNPTICVRTHPFLHLYQGSNTAELLKQVKTTVSSTGQRETSTIIDLTHLNTLDSDKKKEPIVEEKKEPISSCAASETNQSSIMSKGVPPTSGNFFVRGTICESIQGNNDVFQGMSPTTGKYSTRDTDLKAIQQNMSFAKGLSLIEGNLVQSTHQMTQDVDKKSVSKQGTIITENVTKSIHSSTSEKNRVIMERYLSINLNNSLTHNKLRAPQKNKNPFTHFCRKYKPIIYQTIQKNTLGISRDELKSKIQLTAQIQWRALTQEQREIYFAKSALDRERYEREMKLYSETKDLSLTHPG